MADPIEASATALCTKAEALAFLTITDSADDAEVVRLIEAASKAIRRHCGGPLRFLDAAADERRYYLSGESVVYPCECIVPTSLTDSSDNAIAYEAVMNQDASCVMWLELDHNRWGSVKVGGTFGIGVPEDVKQAALVTVKVWYLRSRGQSEADRYGNLRALPQEAIELLQSYVGE